MIVPATHPDRIAKNTSYMTIALVVQKVLSFAYFAYISRSVGVDNIGVYLYALALGTVFGIFIDFGLSPVLTREGAKTPAESSRLLNTVLSGKVLSAILMYGAIVLMTSILGESGSTRSLVMLAGIIMVLDSFTLSQYATLRAHQILGYESIGTIVNKVIVIAAGVIGLEVFGFGTRWLMIAILAGSVFNLLYSSSMLWRKRGWRPRLRIDTSLLKGLLTIALPFALANIFVTVYGSADSILLKHLTGGDGNAYVGWYGTAYKLTFALQFIPIAVGAAIYPAMSAYFVRSRELLEKTFQRAMFYLILIAVPIATGIGILASDLIIRIWGDAFSASIIPLRVLIASLPFIFMNFPIGALLNATNNQVKNTRNIAIVMMVSIAANIVFIPRYTFIAASVVSLSTAVLWFLLGIGVSRKVINVHIGALLVTVLKSVVSAGVLAAFLLIVGDALPLLGRIGLGVVLYAAVLYLVRGYRWHDVAVIYRSVVRKLTDAS